MKPIIEVVAAVIRRADGRLLISLRPEDADQGGLWEFPGGKREPNESRYEALRRELNEELGIEIFEPLPLLTLRYEYPTRIVHLDVWEVLRWNGSERGCEGQRIAWVLPDELNRYDFPAANKTIVLAAQLPRALITLPHESLSARNSTMRILAWREVGIGCIVSELHSVGTDQSSAVNRSAENGIVLLGSAAKMLRGVRQPLPDGAGATPTLARTGTFAALCRTISELLMVERHSIDIAVVDKAGWEIGESENIASGWTRVTELIGHMATPSYLATRDITDITRAVVTGFQGIILHSEYWDKDPVATAHDFMESLARVSIE